MPSYLNDLNEMQRKAVEYCDGPSLVIASAGSGKTRVLTYKIAYLLQLGYKPWSIMALTFTNKAADVMKERIDILIGEGSSKNMWMGTFHSIFLRILRYECHSIGFEHNFTIYDQSSSETLVKAIIKEDGLDDKVYNYKSIASKISNLKSRLITPLHYQNHSEYIKQDALARTPHFNQIYTKYFDRCKLANAMDFDDILLYTYLLFKNTPEVLKKYADRFHYILVDEYQDTNYAQHVIVNLLTSVHRKLCVVGDDAQSIYSFRGASINNILKFNQVYPEYKLFKLEQNYRSTQMIVKAANSVISNNEIKIDKVAFSDNETGDKINLYEASSDIEEGYYVINRIAFLHENEHLGFSSFAILYRTNSQSRVFEEALRKKGYPYIVYGGLSFYQRKEIKDIISYFRLVANHNDEDAFRRIINYPKRGIGNSSISKIIDFAVSSNMSVWDVVANLEQYDTKISKGTLSRILEFKDLIIRFSNLLNNNIYEIAKVILQESGIMRELYSDMTAEGKSRQENMEELITAINTFVQTRIEEGNPNISLLDYLTEISLISDIDETDDKDNCIKLMTVHSAKGLEFNTVFVVGMEENLFPSLRNNTLREIEEERRLFYVAITRAEKRCYISYANSRYRYGKQEFSTVSRFIDELDKEYIRSYIPKQNLIKSRRDIDSVPELSWLKRYKDRHLTQQPDKTAISNSRRLTPFQNRFDQPVTTASQTNEVQHNVVYDLSVGDYILHDRFGKGFVEKLEGDDIQCKALVDFDEVGKKQLLLKFAKFRKVNS